ncbi:hypothetical protein [Hymenobacter lapidiphilus]|uniref:Uncharacterized protein n=1 Tax=Hymenobacter lapidiphilus TaxID=2608003 RepID=A0A7Y7PQV2_9BACT|nr:hypothetical protein [Hymenobacter lapidiphilus]NVO32366.1 hypothetical protein [Hymenobacter lapidiphilus]
MFLLLLFIGNSDALAYAGKPARTWWLSAPDTLELSPSYWRNASALVEQAVREEGWLNFKYADTGGFNSLKQYRRQGSCRIVPVAYLSAGPFQRYQPGEDLGQYWRWDTLHFQAVAYQRHRPVGLLLFQTSADTSSVYFSCADVPGPGIAKYKQGLFRLYVTASLGAYCIRSNGRVWVLNPRTGGLQTVDAWMQQQGGVVAIKQKVAYYYSDN